MKVGVDDKKISQHVYCMDLWLEEDKFHDDVTI